MWPHMLYAHPDHPYQGEDLTAAWHKEIILTLSHFRVSLEQSYQETEIRVFKWVYL